MIDIGVNLSSKRFKGDVADVLTRAVDANVLQMVLTGTSVDESRAVLSICEEYSDQFPSMLFATCGIHPHDALSFNTQSLDAIPKPRFESVLLALVAPAVCARQGLVVTFKEFTKMPA